MNLYKIKLHLPHEADLNWLAEQCDKWAWQSPAFMQAVSTACREELLQRQNGDHAKLVVPWILDDQDHYLAACRLIAVAMISANAHSQLTLRDLLSTLLNVLFNQMNQGIAAELEDRVLN